MAKPKPPISSWLAQQRKAAGLKPGELAGRLRERGLRAEEGTVRTWEAGRKPSDDAIAELERIFGAQAPTSTAVDVDAARGEAILAMTAAIKEQTQVMRELLQTMQAEHSRAYSADDVRALFDVLRSQGLLLTTHDTETTGSELAPPEPAKPRARQRYASRATP